MKRFYADIILGIGLLWITMDQRRDIPYPICPYTWGSKGNRGIYPHLQFWTLSFYYQQPDSGILLLSSTVNWLCSIGESIFLFLNYIYQFIIKRLNLCLDNWTIIMLPKRGRRTGIFYNHELHWIGPQAWNKRIHGYS